MPISRLSWAKTISRTNHNIYKDLHARTVVILVVIDLIANLFRHNAKAPSAHDQHHDKTRSFSFTTLTMPPEPQRESQRNYIRSAAYQIAHTPKATPREFPGSFEDDTKDYTERQVKNVPHPATNKPKDEEFFAHDRNGAPIPNLDFIREHFLAEGKLTEQQAIYILERTTDLLSREPNMLSVPSPVTGESLYPIGPRYCLTMCYLSLWRHSRPVCMYRTPALAQSIH